MPLGFESYNDAGRLQLNAFNPVMQLVGSGTASVSGAGAIGSSTFRSKFQVSYQVAGGLPIIAIAPSGFTTMVGSRMANGVYTVFYETELTDGSTVPFWVFDNMPITSLGFGLELYDENGTRIAGMARKPLRITTTLLDGETNAYSYGNGRKYAAAISGRSYESFVRQVDVYDPTRPGSANLSYYGGRSMSVKSITSGIQTAKRTNFFDAGRDVTYLGNYTQNTGVMIIDVTDYGQVVPGGPVATGAVSLNSAYYVMRTHTGSSVTCVAETSGGTPVAFAWSIRGFGQGIGVNWTVSSNTQSTSLGVAIDPAVWASTGNILSGVATCYVTFDNGTIASASTALFVINNGSSGGTPPPVPAPGSEATVAISPSSFYDTGSSVNSRNVTFTAILTGAEGASIAYQWSVINQVGNWAIVSATNSMQIAARASGIPAGQVAQASLVCTATINGVAKTATANLVYENVGSGGTVIP